MTLQTPARPLRWPDAVHTLRELLADRFPEVYLVGGTVRDAFWGLPVHDIDLAVESQAFAVARHIANALGGAFYKLDPARETGRAILTINGETLAVDVACFRGPDLHTDLLGRDFTLNAVAVPLNSDLTQVIDPLDGLQDATNRVLRRCSPDSIRSDPVRALRAVRLAVRFGLRIEPTTLADIREFGPLLVNTSPERIRDEFIALLGTPRAMAGIRTLKALNLLHRILPELSAERPEEEIRSILHVADKLAGIIDTISPRRTDNTAAQAGLGMIVYYLDRYRAALWDHLAAHWPNNRPHTALLMLSALLSAPHPATVPPESIRDAIQLRGDALRLSRDESERIATTVLTHRRAATLLAQQAINRRISYRYWRDLGPAGVDALLLSLAHTLAEAGPTLSTDHWSHLLQNADTLLSGYFPPEGQPRITDLPVLLTGKDLMRQFNLSPGPQIGELLEAVREAQAVQEIATRQEAEALVAQLLSEKK
ncbi:MAG: CCA tRNA nucleotidyltransferase [Anaerolineae bacterium]